jgi:hypothetical protein
MREKRRYGEVVKVYPLRLHKSLCKRFHSVVRTASHGQCYAGNHFLSPPLPNYLRSISTRRCAEGSAFREARELAEPRLLSDAQLMAAQNRLAGIRRRRGSYHDFLRLRSLTTLKSRRDARAGLRQIQSCSRPDHELSSTAPMALHAAVRKTPPLCVSVARKGHRDDR